MENKRGQLEAGIEQPVGNGVVREKKSFWWLWILIILVVIVVMGLVVYFLWFSGGSDGSSVLGVGNSIPQPPALPSG